MTDDDELAVRAAGGDESAFRTLVDRHYDPCLRFAAHRLGRRAEAEDVVQETFVRAYRSLKRYRPEGKFRAWLFRILVNRCRTAIGRRRDFAEADPASLERMASPEPAHDRTALWRDEIRRALSTLPDALREAFLLKFVEGYSYEEMRDLTGAGTSALKMRVSRAREQMREQLEEVRHG